MQKIIISKFLKIPTLRECAFFGSILFLLIATFSILQALEPELEKYFPNNALKTVWRKSFAISVCKIEIIAARLHLKSYIIFFDIITLEMHIFGRDGNQKNR